MNITGAGIDRVDGRLKVCGLAPYAAEFIAPRLAHAVLVTSSVAKGRIARMDGAAVAALPGVLAVLTPFDAPRLPQAGKAVPPPPAGRVLSLLQDDLVHYTPADRRRRRDTLERAAEGARRLQVTYAADGAAAALDFDAAKARAFAPEKANREPAAHRRGDLAAGLAAARTVSRRATPCWSRSQPDRAARHRGRRKGERPTLHDERSTSPATETRWRRPSASRRTTSR